MLKIKSYTNIDPNFNKESSISQKSKSLSFIKNDKSDIFKQYKSSLLKSIKSFILTESDKLFPSKLNKNSISLTMDSCLTCNNYYVKKSNNYCSFQCYKESKKDSYGFLHIRCPICNNYFTTKCMFTDYCSNKCFSQELSDKIAIII